MKKLREILGEDYSSLEKDLAAYKQRKQSVMQPQTNASKIDFQNDSKFQDIRNRAQDFYRKSFGSEPPTSLNDTRPVDTTGANSPFADPSVKSYTVTPDKPFISGKINTALADKGYDQTGKKITSIPKETGTTKADIPVGSFPKKEPVEIPIPREKPKDLVPNPSFSQAFAAAVKSGKKEFDWIDPKTGKSGSYNTKIKKR